MNIEQQLRVNPGSVRYDIETNPELVSVFEHSAHPLNRGWNDQAGRQM